MSQPPINRPWVGKQYTEGVSGRRIAICGYSHWGNDDEEAAASTTEFEEEEDLQDH